MAKYRVTQHYRSSTIVLERNRVIELETEIAEWVNRDSPGTLEPYQEPPKATAVAAAPDEPASTRMVTKRRPGRPRKAKDD